MKGPTQRLQRPGDGGRRHTTGEVGSPAPLMFRHPGRGVAHRGEEGVAQPGQRRLADRAGIASPAHGVSHRRQRGGPVVFGQRGENRVGRGVELRGPAAGNDPLQRGQGVAHRSAACGHCMVDGFVVHVQLSVTGDVPEVVGHDLRVDQSQLEHLAAAADGVHHLVGLGGGQQPMSHGRGAPPRS